MGNRFYRKERLEKQFAQIINETLLFQINDERIASEIVSVTRVEFNLDMTTATVYVRVLKASQKNKMIKTLYNSAPFFMRTIISKIGMKNYPKLRFFIDEKEEKASNTLDLISRLSAEMKANSPLPEKEVAKKTDENSALDAKNTKKLDDENQNYPKKNSSP